MSAQQTTIVATTNAPSFLIYGVASVIQLVPTLTVDAMLMPLDRITTLRQVVDMTTTAASPSSSTQQHEDEDEDDKKKKKEEHSFTHVKSPFLQRSFIDRSTTTAQLLEITTEEQGLYAHFTGILPQSLKTITASMAQIFITPKLFLLWRKFIKSSSSSSSSRDTVLISLDSLSWPTLALKSCVEIMNLITGHPFEFIRTRMICSELVNSRMDDNDNGDDDDNDSASSNSSSHSLKMKSYSNMFDCARDLYHTEGILAFFRGIDASLFAVVPSTALLLYLNKKAKVRSVDSKSWTEPWIEVGTALFVKSLVTTVFYPIEVIKRRMTMSGAKGWHKSGKPYKNSFDCAKRMVCEEGWGSLFRGLSTQLFKQVARSVLGKMAFDIVKYQVQMILTTILRALQ